MTVVFEQELDKMKIQGNPKISLPCQGVQRKRVHRHTGTIENMISFAKE